MKLKFRHQPFQADAANAVCDVFAGQPFRTATTGEGLTAFGRGEGIQALVIVSAVRAG